MHNPSLTHWIAAVCAALLLLTGLALGQEAPATPRVTVPGVGPGAQVRINQIETSRFPQVAIFATVLKDGVPVPGLTAQDFRVREDEVDQEPLTVAPKLTPLAAVLTLDTSGSMKKRLADAQTAAKGFLKALKPQDRVQVIRFSRDVKTIAPLGTDRAAAEGAIGSTVARGDTALWDALYASVEALRDVTGRKAIILLSDGVDDDGTGKPLSKRTVADVLALAAQVNVPIYAIGLGTELDEPALKQVATESGALYFNAVEASELTRLYDSIGKQLAGQYTISYDSNLPADGLEHRVQLKVGDSTGTKSYLPAATAAPVAAPAVAPAPVVAAPVGTEVEVPTREFALAPGKARLAAQLGVKTPPITKDQAGMWKVLDAEGDLQGRHKQLALYHEAQPIVALTAGEYLLEVDVGDAQRQVALHVQEGAPAKGTVILGAGQVRLQARLSPQTPVLTKDVTGMWRILEGQADFEGSRKKIAMHHVAQPIVTLNAGDYGVLVRVGEAERVVELNVQAGEQKPFEVVLGAGQVKLVARQGPAGTAPITKGQSGMWRIFAGQGDFDGSRKQIAMNHDAQPILTLLEGDYRVRVRVGEATQEVDLNVKAGEQKVVEVDLAPAAPPAN